MKWESDSSLSNFVGIRLLPPQINNKYVTRDDVNTKNDKLIQ